MATGDLDKSAFQHYVGQDFVYLGFFMRAYELTLAKCEGEGMAELNPCSGLHATTTTTTTANTTTQNALLQVREALSGFIEGVRVEMGVQVGYAASWGVELSEVEASPATLAYTGFLIEVASSPDTSVAHVFAAMAPCARLYAFLACQLAGAHGGTWHASPYAHWIASYSAREYLDLPALSERLLDGMGTDADEGALAALYARAMVLELAFFDAQPLGLGKGGAEGGLEAA
ncbi:hypothetical protein FOA52_005374 [Chlamydomonas sp. UWO 241]|nr:hypothetical protein FOA52_005374 [Chlamydomonas sp. UWO 241]